VWHSKEKSVKKGQGAAMMGILTFCFKCGRKEGMKVKGLKLSF
jgi:hypothetical protein